MRMIAISATIPNIEDLSEWLSSSGVKAEEFVFGEEYRPVKLIQKVYGVHANHQNPWVSDKVFSQRLIKEISEQMGKQTLVFCMTKKM